MKTTALPVTAHGDVARALGIDGNPNASVKFTCTKCRHNTSGVFLTDDHSFSQCPACQSVLIYCPVCRRTASSTTKYRVTRCDSCSTDFVTDRTIGEILKRDRESVNIVLSGVRATGRLHLGNFFGAVRNFVKFERGENLCLYFIADWHTLTTFQNPSIMSANVLAVATDYLAAGLNPERSIIYAQSSIPEIAELSLYLSMFQRKNVLEDLPTLKDLVKGDSVTLGHLGYPVLMAADILGPQATVVPVGADQRSNVEIARDLADVFNRRYGKTFVVPQIASDAIKIPGLRGGKMGKSESEEAVQLTDTLEEITRKYSRAVTDAGKVTAGSSGNPGNCVSVYPVYETLFFEEQHERLVEVARTCADGSRSCRDCKAELARELHGVLAPFQERRRELESKQDFVKEVLHYGGITAREMVQRTLEDVRSKLGVIKL